jgi:hypothetical protein
METNLSNSILANGSLKGSPYSLRRIKVLRGYIHPSD